MMFVIVVPDLRPYHWDRNHIFTVEDSIFSMRYVSNWRWRPMPMKWNIYSLWDQLDDYQKDWRIA